MTAARSPVLDRWFRERIGESWRPYPALAYPLPLAELRARLGVLALDDVVVVERAHVVRAAIVEGSGEIRWREWRLGAR